MTQIVPLLELRRSEQQATAATTDGPREQQGQEKATAAPARCLPSTPQTTATTDGRREQQGQKKATAAPARNLPNTPRPPTARGSSKAKKRPPPPRPAAQHAAAPTPRGRRKVRWSPRPRLITTSTRGRPTEHHTKRQTLQQTPNSINIKVITT